jgi:hypothetical protein
MAKMRTKKSKYVSQICSITDEGIGRRFGSGRVRFEQDGKHSSLSLFASLSLFVSSCLHKIIHIALLICKKANKLHTIMIYKWAQIDLQMEGCVCCICFEYELINNVRLFVCSFVCGWRRCLVWWLRDSSVWQPSIVYRLALSVQRLF